MVKQPRHETSSHQQDDVSAGWILEEWFSGLEVDVDGWAKDQGTMRFLYIFIGGNPPAKMKFFTSKHRDFTSVKFRE
jgi:hypothetical protein